MHGNLFVVSRVGQLRNVQSFIRQFDATANHLAVLHTDANPVLYANIRASVAEGLFVETIDLRQPLRPVTQGRRKNRAIYQQMEQLLDDALASDVSNLFLCNSDAYYSLFEKIIRARNLPLTVNLLEEGLGTYAILGPRRYTLDSVADWRDVVLSAKRFARAVRATCRSFAVLSASLLSWLLRRDVVAVIKHLRAWITIPRSQRYGQIQRFDRAFVYFPEKVAQGTVNVGQVTRLGFELEPTASPELLSEVRNDSVVFVSQKYMACATYLRIVFRILDEMGLEQVVFKLHPREDPATFLRISSRLRDEHPSLKVLLPPHVQAVPVEELMMAGKTRLVIGLTSTSLIYGQAFFTDATIVSIGERFKELAESSEYEVTRRELAEFNRDLQVFLDVSNVRQFSPGQSA